MSKKFHINEEGKVKPCTAKSSESCPVKNILGFKTEHFNDIEIAVKRNEEILALKYGNISMSKKNSKIVKTLHDIEIDDNVNSLLNDLNFVGKPLIVGGAVRDSLIGAVSKDIDIEVYGTTLDQIAKVLRKKRMAC